MKKNAMALSKCRADFTLVRFKVVRPMTATVNKPPYG